MRIYENDHIFIEEEKSEIPWIKIFPRKRYKELSDCDEMTRKMLFEIMLLAERTMLEFYNPKKINIAMFGNYLPHLHIHVMARFENDSHFPEPMWGEKQRDADLNLPSFQDFKKILLKKLESIKNI